MRVRQNRNALGAEYAWGQLAEAHERWGDTDCRSMQRVRHRGMADVLFVNESHNANLDVLDKAEMEYGIRIMMYLGSRLIAARLVRDLIGRSGKNT
jgi:hypothetical protein